MIDIVFIPREYFDGFTDGCSFTYNNHTYINDETVVDSVIGSIDDDGVVDHVDEFGVIVVRRDDGNRYHLKYMIDTFDQTIAYESYNNLVKLERIED